MTSGSPCDGVGEEPLGLGFVSWPFNEWLKGKRKGKTIQGGLDVGRTRGVLRDLENGWGSFKESVQWLRAATFLYEGAGRLWGPASWGVPHL